MIYEIRIYEHAEGKADVVRERFEREVAPRFAHHGIELLGTFTNSETGELTYMTRFPDEAARKKGWDSFKSDPGWLAAKKASEVSGPLIVKQHATVLTPAMAGLPLD